MNRKQRTMIAAISARVTTLAYAVKEDVTDDERAHSDEDDIRRDTLRMIADHSTDPFARKLALEALSTSAIAFERWCA